MKADFKIDHEKKLITGTYRDTLNVSDLMECIDHLLNHPDFHEEYNGISDFRNAALDMGYEDLRRFRSWLENQDRKSLGRWAVLVDRLADFGTIRCWEVLSDGYHESLKVFMEEDQAIEWLKADSV